MDPRIAKFLTARDRARKLAGQQRDRLGFARQFLSGLIATYHPAPRHLPAAPLHSALIEEMGEIAQGLDPAMASYLIGTTYTVMLPEEYRGKYGVFYTPPALVERLLDQAEQAGTDWTTAQVLDPACGGGAFLAPVAQRMAAALTHLTPAQRIAHIATHLHGFEIDPFSAWVSQVFVEKVLGDDLAAADQPLPQLIEIGDSLKTTSERYATFDLVIGNPPYGKIKLSAQDRATWKRGLYGHANIYGLFSDLAAWLVAPGGVIAYITPTSFLGGQYFQALRGVLRREAPPVSIDFISSRGGVFADALQEALLAVYRKQADSERLALPVQVSHLCVTEAGEMTVSANGAYALPEDLHGPWLLPRTPAQSEAAELAARIPHRLADLGYTVATGPLVWNRHKDRLHSVRTKKSVPLIWAECVPSDASGDFTFRSTGRNHVPWYEPGGASDSNIVRSSCVLLQRTTSLEQARRLVAAQLPQAFIDRHGGSVTVENHLNMVRPIAGVRTQVSPATIAALLNSDRVDQVYRCISGSVAVSAYELEAMPLPSPAHCAQLETLLVRGAGEAEIAHAIEEGYRYVCTIAAA